MFSLSTANQNNSLSLIRDKKVIIWDNDGTIMGSKNPNDVTSTAKVILPNVEHVMKSSKAIHIICSGCKTAESELQNFEPATVIQRLTKLMQQLPIQAAIFSPAIGGTQCFVIIKKADTIIIRKAHEEKRYEQLIGQFKKPGKGMLVVIKDLLQEEFGLSLHDSLMIGDTWHDEHAATAMNIPFLNASEIHSMKW